MTPGQEQGGAPAPVHDHRDQRDPQQLGEALDRMMRRRSDCPTLRDAADALERLGSPGIYNYDPNPVNHAAERERELRHRAREGDRFAQALLDGDTLAEDPTE